MRIEQGIWDSLSGWSFASGPPAVPDAQIVLVFGSPDGLLHSGVLSVLKVRYPEAIITGCSTAGEIYGTQVRDDSVTATAIRFENAQARFGSISGPISGRSEAAGRDLGRVFPTTGLRHVVVFSDGIMVNGTDLLNGLAGVLPEGVSVSGGLAGDGARMQRTYVIENGAPVSGTIVGLGFYGDGLRIGCGSLGGWDPFGPERLVTRSCENVLYELDGRSALELYKNYLGKHAEQLPVSGLLFPLALRLEGSETSLVRTILSVNETEQSLTFAGEIAEGSYARLMRANFDRLIDGAIGAANTVSNGLGGVTAELAILISCVGRKLVLQQRIEEEVEGVRDVLGPKPVFTGFYSYGEISPFASGEKCELHNQTMTITTLSEV